MNNFISKAICKIKTSSLKDGMLFSLFSFINRGFSFLLLLILANYIAPAEYGYLGLFATVLMVIGFFMAMSTEGYMSVAFFKDGELGIKRTYSFILYLSILMALLFGIILLCIGERLSQMLELSRTVLALTIATAFFTVFTNVNLDYLRLKEQIKPYGLLSCGNALMNFVLSILLVKYCGFGWIGRVWAQLWCYLLFGVGAILFFCRKKMVVKVPCKYCKGILFWGLPLIPHLAANFFRQGCDRYIVNYYHTIEAVGLFSFALNLTNVIVMVGAGFNQSNSVLIYKILGDKEMTGIDKKIKINEIIKNNILIYVVLTFFIIGGMDLLVPFLLPKYTGSLVYFNILGMYGLLQCLYFIYSNFLFFYNKTKEIMYITFCSSLFHLSLSLLLTRYSLLFTCIVYAVSQFVIIYVLRRYSIKILNINI